MTCSVLSCSVLSCYALCMCFFMICSVMFRFAQFCHARRKGGWRDNRGHSGQLGVWRPRYAGWEWPGGLSLKSNDPSQSGGESLFVYDVFLHVLLLGTRWFHECAAMDYDDSRRPEDGSKIGPRRPKMAPERIPSAPRRRSDASRRLLDSPRRPQASLSLSLSLSPSYWLKQ